MKKLLSFLLIIVLTLSLTTSTFAVSNNSGTVKAVPEAIKVVDITYDEYIKIIADEKGISIDEAKKLDMEQNQKNEKKLAKNFPNLKSVNSLDSGSYSYQTIEQIFTYPYNSSFKAAITATIKIYTYGSFRQINYVQGISSRRVAGLYEYSWVQSYVWQDPGNEQMPCTSVNLGAVGYFEVTVSKSLGLSGGLPGFSISGELSNDVIYQSNTLSMQTTYSVY